MLQTRTPDGRLMSLEKYISNLGQEIDDLEWESNFVAADLLKPILEAAQKRREQGEVWEPMF